MEHFAGNAELARLAHTEALRATHAPLAPRHLQPAAAPARAVPPPVAHLSALLLPELPLELRWPGSAEPAA